MLRRSRRRAAFSWSSAAFGGVPADTERAPPGHQDVRCIGPPNPVGCGDSLCEAAASSPRCALAVGPGAPRAREHPDDAGVHARDEPAAEDYSEPTLNGVSWGEPRELPFTFSHEKAKGDRMEDPIRGVGSGAFHWR